MRQPTFYDKVTAKQRSEADGVELQLMFYIPATILLVATLATVTAMII